MKNPSRSALKWFALVLVGFVWLAPTSSRGQIGLWPPQILQWIFPPGISLVATPLPRDDYRISALFPRAVLGTTFSKLNPITQKYSVSIFGRTGWSNPNETLAPGEGAVVFNPSSKNITNYWFAFDLNSIFSRPIVSLSAGISLVSLHGVNFSPPPPGMIPLSFITSIQYWPWWWSIGLEPSQFNPQDGDVVWTYNQLARRFDRHNYRASTGWDSLPVVGANEACFVQTTHARIVEPYVSFNGVTTNPFLWNGGVWTGDLVSWSMNLPRPR
jgi:hypothetical protein